MAWWRVQTGEMKRSARPQLWVGRLLLLQLIMMMMMMLLLLLLQQPRSSAGCSPAVWGCSFANNGCVASFRASLRWTNTPLLFPAVGGEKQAHLCRAVWIISTGVHLNADVKIAEFCSEHKSNSATDSFMLTVPRCPLWNICQTLIEDGRLSIRAGHVSACPRWSCWSSLVLSKITQLDLLWSSLGKVQVGS